MVGMVRAAVLLAETRLGSSAAGGSGYACGSSQSARPACLVFLSCYSSTLQFSLALPFVQTSRLFLIFEQVNLACLLYVSTSQ